MMNKIYRTTDEDKNCLSCKYYMIEDIWFDSECSLTGRVLLWDEDDEDYPICNNYVSSED